MATTPNTTNLVPYYAQAYIMKIGGTATTTTTTTSAPGTTTTTSAPGTTTTTAAPSTTSITLNINDSSFALGGGSYQHGYSITGLGSLSPTTSSLWIGNITTIASYTGGTATVQTFLKFSDTQFYTGPYYITYRGTKYTLEPNTSSDPDTWYVVGAIFGGYGAGTVVISTV